jgi:hypothetical protein
MTLQLENYEVSELSHSEQRETDGGFLPLAVMYACWGVMIACSAVAAGFKQALNDKQAQAPKPLNED